MMDTTSCTCEVYLYCRGNFTIITNLHSLWQIPAKVVLRFTILPLGKKNAMCFHLATEQRSSAASQWCTFSECDWPRQLRSQWHLVTYNLLMPLCKKPWTVYDLSYQKGDTEVPITVDPRILSLIENCTRITTKSLLWGQSCESSFLNREFQKVNWNWWNMKWAERIARTLFSS